MTINNINELVRICLDMADLADTHGEQGSTPDFLNEMGVGFRAFSRKLRRGVIEIINLQDRYHREVDNARLAKLDKEEMQKFVEDVFGDADVCELTFSDRDKQRIQEFMRQLEAE